MIKKIQNVIRNQYAFTNVDETRLRIKALLSSNTFLIKKRIKVSTTLTRVTSLTRTKI
jgi:hypothetical protein